MNRKQLTILVALAVVIGGVGIVAYKGKKSDWAPSGTGDAGRVVADFPMNEISEIKILTRDGEVNLAKADTGWTVSDRGGYPANFDDIHELLRTVWEMEPIQKPKVGESNLGRLKLMDPKDAAEDDDAATRVDFKAGGATHTLYLGKEHVRKTQSQGPMGGGSFPDGRYVMVGDDLSSVSLVEHTFSSVASSPESWLNKDFLKVEKIKSIQYRPAAATNGWSISRESDSGDFAFADGKEGETLDSSKVSGLKFFMSSPSFVDVAAGKSDADTGLDKPVTATVETFDGFKYDLSIGKKDEKDQYFIKVNVAATLANERTPGEDEKEEDKERLDKEHKEKLKKLEEKLAKEKKFAGHVYVVSKFTIDALLKDRKDLLKVETDAADSGAPGAIPPAGVPPMLAPPTGGLPPGFNLPPNPPAAPPAQPDSLQKIAAEAAAADSKSQKALETAVGKAQETLEKAAESKKAADAEAKAMKAAATQTGDKLKQKAQDLKKQAAETQQQAKDLTKPAPKTLTPPVVPPLPKPAAPKPAAPKADAPAKPKADAPAKPKAADSPKPKADAPAKPKADTPKPKADTPAEPKADTPEPKASS